ncbi:MAG: hypothetical protein FWF30_04040, partial [Coriobacteriia bacterium]|nr:hypothetical protein [Coriobacteriia bacterium]
AATAPHIRHVHVHNNYHTGDAHNPPGDGLINIRAALLSISALQPLATYTAETSALEASVEWFLQQGFISGAKS